MTAAGDPTPLLLPGGRTVEVTGDPRDLSVLEHLRVTGGEWEPHVRVVMERLIRPDWVCLDIGADIGAHTIVLSELAAQVFAFEANPLTYRYLLRNVAGRSNVTIVHTALWHEAGTINLAESSEFAGAAFVTQGHELDGTTHTRQVGDRFVDFEIHVHDVPAIKLDDWAEELKRIDLIKIDVEGAEQQVLAGAERSLARFRPILLTEYNPATAAELNGESDSYFRVLDELYDSIELIEPDGSRCPITSWSELEERIARGKGWEDLICFDAGRAG